MYYEVSLNGRLLGRVVMEPFTGRAVLAEVQCLLVMTLVSEKDGCRIYKVATYKKEKK